MKCSLCHAETKLLKKSHIIPDFMYNGMFGQKHRLSHVNLKDLKELKSVPTGIYDKDILCVKCDNEVIGKYETYASKAIYGGDLLGKESPVFKTQKNVHGFVSVLVNNIDYVKFKLFLLSILWRAHVSKQVFFAEIDLGKYAEKIRRMIVEGDAGEETELQTAIFFIKSDTLPLKSIIAPRYLKDEGNSSYAFYINEAFYHFNLSEHNKLEIFDKGYIGKNNLMQVAVLEGVIATNHFDSFVGGKIKLRKKK